MRRTIGTLALAVVAGCSHRLGPPQVEYGTMAAVPIVHPSNDDRWYLAVDAGSLGPRLFFFDTGYSYTTCDDDFVAELGLELRGHVVVHGEAGDITAKKAELPPFELGGHRIEGLTCLVRDLHTTSSIDDPVEVRVAGVLGSDVLRRFDMVIDPTRAEVDLYAPKERPALERRDPDTVRMRREYWIGLRFAVPVEVDGRRIWPVVDTGANGTHVDGPRMGLVPTVTHSDVPVRASGANGGEVRDLVYYRVDGVAIAETRIGPVMLTGRERAPWVPGLLGLNVLGRFEQEYDFRKGLARYRLVEPTDVPSWTEWAAIQADDEGAAVDAEVSP